MHSLNKSPKLAIPSWISYKIPPWPNLHVFIKIKPYNHNSAYVWNLNQGLIRSTPPPKNDVLTFSVTLYTFFSLTTNFKFWFKQTQSGHWLISTLTTFYKVLSQVSLLVVEKPPFVALGLFESGNTTIAEAFCNVLSLVLFFMLLKFVALLGLLESAKTTLSSTFH